MHDGFCRQGTVRIEGPDVDRCRLFQESGSDMGREVPYENRRVCDGVLFRCREPSARAFCPDAYRWIIKRSRQSCSLRSAQWRGSLGAKVHLPQYAPAATLSKEYIRFGGQVVAIENATAGAPCQTCYLSYDHLGSVRMVTDQNAAIIARHDYLPFGEEILGGEAGRSSQWGATDSVNQKFTGQERDAETNLDFFQARYYTGGVMRFLSPDPGNAGADLTNPQSWNGYSYVMNGPMNATDPTGTDTLTFEATGYCVDCQDQTQVPLSSAWWWLTVGGGQQQVNQQQATSVVQQAIKTVSNWLTAPRDPNCVQGAADAGEAIGAVGGAVAGAMGGGAAGATLGSIVPGPGNVAATAGGAVLGAGRGAAVGGALGYLGGMAAGYLSCASSTGSGGGGGGATDHGNDRLGQRNVSQQDVDQAIESAKETGQVTTQIGKYGTPQNVYKGTNGLTVVIETAGRNAGKIITAWWR